MGVADRNRLLSRMVAATALARNVSVRIPRMAGPCQARACPEGGRAGTYSPASKPALQERSRMALKGKASKVHRRRWHPHPVSSVGAPLIVVDIQGEKQPGGEGLSHGPAAEG